LLFHMSIDNSKLRWEICLLQISAIIAHRISRSSVQHTCLIFESSGVHTSTCRSDIVIEVLCGFSHSLQEYDVNYLKLVHDGFAGYIAQLLHLVIIRDIT
jgi:hypothetical protein